MKDLYEILDITNEATPEDIKKAYRNLAKKYHPDVVGDNEELNMQFQEIKEAYKILDNAEKRKGYDAMQARLSQLEEESIEDDEEKAVAKCEVKNKEKNISKIQNENGLLGKLNKFFRR